MDDGLRMSPAKMAALADEIEARGVRFLDDETPFSSDELLVTAGALRTMGSIFTRGDKMRRLG